MNGLFSLEFVTAIVSIALLFGPAGLLLVPNARRVVVGLLSHKRPEEPYEHDPEQSLRQPVSHPFAVVTALLLSAAVMFLLVRPMTGVAARIDLAHFTSIKSSFAKEVAPGEPLKDTLGTVEDELAEKQKGAERWLRMFTFGSDEDLSDAGLIGLVHTYFKNERGPDQAKGENLPATEAFANLLLGTNLAQAPAKPGSPLVTNQKIKQAICDAIAPSNLEPLSYTQFIQLMELRELRSLKTDDKDSAGRAAVQRAVYERVSAEVEWYLRLRRLFVGPIQWLTIFAFYLCLLLLAGRRELISMQELDSIDEYINAAPGLREAIKNQLDARPDGRSGLLARVTDEQGLLREEELLRTIMRVWTDPKNPRARIAPHLLAPSLALGALMEIREAGGSDAAAHRVTRVIGDAAERYERWLDRVTYAGIQYAIVAIPSLGFIGTVIGIGAALGSADAVVNATTPEARADAVAGVTAVLGFAFDTTLIALAASLVASGFLAAIRSRESSTLEAIRRDIGTHYAGSSDE